MQVFPYPFFLQFKIIDIWQNTVKRNIVLDAYIQISKKPSVLDLFFTISALPLQKCLKFGQEL